MGDTGVLRLREPEGGSEPPMPPTLGSQPRRGHPGSTTPVQGSQVLEQELARLSAEDGKSQRLPEAGEGPAL